MKMHNCFDGLLAAIPKTGVTGVAGVAPNTEASKGKELASGRPCNTHATNLETRVSAKPIELSRETPATPETPWREMYEERAGTMEYEAGFPRDKAEVMAYWDTFALFVQRRHPALVTEFEAMLHQLLN